MHHLNQGASAPNHLIFFASQRASPLGRAAAEDPGALRRGARSESPSLERPDAFGPWAVHTSTFGEAESG